MTARTERFVRGKSMPVLIGILVLLILAWGVVSAVDWWLARVMPLWLFDSLAMATFAAVNLWRGWRKATRK